MSTENKSAELKNLIERIQIGIDNISNSSLSIIEKDILLSQIRSLYEKVLPLEIKMAGNEIIVKNEEENVNKVVKTETNPVSIISNYEIDKQQDKIIEIEVSEKADNENKKIVTAEIQEKQIDLPIETPKPTFDDLVNKVKEQMNHQAKPQDKQFVSIVEEEDEDKPVLFSDLNLDILFSTKNPSELSDRLSQSHIDDIGRAMGLNERIFTLNELFDGNNTDFEKSLQDLNDANSFAAAKEIIAMNLAVKYNWLTDSKIKKARDFVKLVKRRFV
ncbi:MAG TPA: hypothetical protein VK590_00845 [Saprospiraceae bacterium]|nr:hypothetical protein [Saprospiraceae bacterium]